MDSTWAELGRAAAAPACRVSERNASCLIWWSGFLVWWCATASYRMYLLTLAPTMCKAKDSAEVDPLTERRLLLLLLIFLPVYFRSRRRQCGKENNGIRETFHFIIFCQINFHCMSRRIVDLKWMSCRCGDVFACGLPFRCVKHYTICHLICVNI